MKRMLPLMVLVLLITGPSTGSRESAEAAPKKVKPVACKVELAQTKQQLADSQAESAKEKAELEALLTKEHERVKRLEAALSPGPDLVDLDGGPPARAKKEPPSLKGSGPIDTLK